MNQSSTKLERQVGAWFAEGPERAPAGLLAATIARTSGTRQRPAIVAVALGAPSAAERGALRIESRLVWLMLALAATAIATAVIVAGLPRPAIVVAPSPRATPFAIAPSPTPLGTPGSTAEPLLFTSEQLGFAVARDVLDPWTEHLDSWNGHLLGTPEWVAEFDYGSCPGSCGGNVSVSSSSPWFGVVVGWTTECGALSAFECAAFESRGGGPFRLRGASLDELATGWVARFGPAERTSRSIEGLDALVMQNEAAVGALLVRGGQTFAVMVHADDASSTDDEVARLERFLDAMSFPDPPADLYRNDALGLVVSELDSGPWRLHRGWGSGPGDEGSVALWFGSCVDNLCNEPYISVSDGAAATGAIVGRDDAGLLRVRGSTLAELRAAWSDLFGPSTFEETTLDGTPAFLASDGTAHMAVLAVRDGRVIGVGIQPPAFLGFNAAALEERLRAFSEGAVYFQVP